MPSPLAQAWRRKPLGRPGALGAAQKKALTKALLVGAVANGFPNELWTLPRVAKLIERDYGVRHSTANVWRIHCCRGYAYSAALSPLTL